MESESQIEEQAMELQEDESVSEVDRQSVEFSLMWTIVSTVLVGAGMGLMVWAYDSRSPLDHVEDPERALAHIASRSMNLEASITQAPKWEQSLYRVLHGDDDNSKQLIKWYDELENESMDPVSSLYAAVLEAEAGNLDLMKERVATWNFQENRFLLFRDILEVAYGEKDHDSEEITVLQARLAEEIPDNWFYSRLAVRLAEQENNSSFSRLTQNNVVSRLTEIFWRNRVLMLAEMGGAFVSLVALFIVLWCCYFKGKDALMVSNASLPPPWSGGDGFAVLMRGGALTLLLLSGLGAFLGAYFSFIDRGVDSKLLELMSVVILYAPIPILLHYYLLRPKGRSFRQVFGLQLRFKKIGVLALTVLALFAGGLFGDWAISLAGSVLGKSTHWTEWFNDSLVWGGTSDVVILFLQVAVLAPIFEEFIFRGLVFASLRRWFGWFLSAVFSAIIFAVIHGYGIIGFCAVGWSGFLWAWAYEKTGSLLPGIVAHALNNLVFFVSLLVVFR